MSFIFWFHLAPSFRCRSFGSKFPQRWWGNFWPLGEGVSSSVLLCFIACLGPVIQKQTFLGTLGLMEYRIRHFLNLTQNTKSWWLVGWPTGCKIRDDWMYTPRRFRWVPWGPVPSGIPHWEFSSLQGERVLQADWQHLVESGQLGSVKWQQCPQKASLWRGYCFLLGHVCPDFRWTYHRMASTAHPTCSWFTRYLLQGDQLALPREVFP